MFRTLQGIFPSDSGSNSNLASEHLKVNYVPRGLPLVLCSSVVNTFRLGYPHMPYSIFIFKQEYSILVIEILSSILSFSTPIIIYISSSIPTTSHGTHKLDFLSTPTTPLSHHLLLSPSPPGFPTPYSPRASHPLPHRRPSSLPHPSPAPLLPHRQLRRWIKVAGSRHAGGVEYASPRLSRTLATLPLLPRRQLRHAGRAGRRSDGRSA